MDRRITYIVKREDLPASAALIMEKRLGFTRRQIRNAKYKDEGIMADGVRIRASRMMREGEELSVLAADGRTWPDEGGENRCFPAGEDGSARPDERGETRRCGEAEAGAGIPEILYEDEDLIAVCKPAFMNVHPGRVRYGDSLSEWLEEHFKVRGEEHIMRPVGRLDKEASGIVIFAKHRTAASWLFSEGNCRKVYYALVRGRMDKNEGVLEYALAKDPENPLKMCVCEKGMFCRTFYKVIAGSDEGQLLEVRLQTGRTHQIRVHMMQSGHPLFGDTLYGTEAEKNAGRTGGQADESAAKNHGITGTEADRSACPIKRAALHCARAEIVRPFGQGKVTVCCPMSEDMESVYRLIRQSGSSQEG